MKLTQQESQVLNFLSKRTEVFWEELAQFCKNPTTVKLKTVQKVVSDLRKKFTDNDEPIPFKCSFRSLASKREPNKMITTNETVSFNGQNLVQIKRRRTGDARPLSTASAKLDKKVLSASTPPDKVEPVPDFSIKEYTRQVVTRSGVYSLNIDEYEIFKYFFTNQGRFIALEELRDNVCYPKFGSKTPARWFSAIQRRVGNIRHQVPETKNRLLTAKQNSNSGYIFS